MRFIQWAYKEDYDTEEPDIVPDESSITTSLTSKGASKTKPSTSMTAEKPLYSISCIPVTAESPDTDACHNSECSYYGTSNDADSISTVCLVCRQPYETDSCYDCGSVFSKCPRQQCASRTLTTAGAYGSCSRTQCAYYGKKVGKRLSINTSLTCPRCQQKFDAQSCRNCTYIFSDCPRCYAVTKRSKKKILIDKFMGEHGGTTLDPTSTPSFVPRKNTDGREDYSGVLLCHAKLYVLGDTYDIPPLRQLALHRLHATLRDFTLYPSRLGDIAALARYVFDNTTPDDKIRDMITLYYACIVEDASKHEGLRALVDDIPDFAFGLISRMSERLE